MNTAISAAVTVFALLGAAAHAQAPLPCEAVSSNAFSTEQWYAPSTGIAILEAGTVVSENRGSNLCSILLDTSRGRVRFYFTTAVGVGGGVIVSRVAVREVALEAPPVRPAYVPFTPPPQAPMTQPVSLPTAAPPTVDPNYAAFSSGRSQRIAWETFIGGVVGDEHDGAVFWSGQRSLRNPASCSTAPTDLFRRGCEEAQAILGPSDVLRKTNPAYRLGWNSL